MSNGTSASANSYRKIRVFVASPGDVAKEKDALGKVITSLNRTLGDRFGIVLELKEWRQVAPAMGRPEDVILAELRVESWDIFVGILWLRFGMAPGAVDPSTGRPFDSGTEEELRHGKRGMMGTRARFDTASPGRSLTSQISRTFQRHVNFRLVAPSAEAKITAMQQQRTASCTRPVGEVKAFLRQARK